MTAPKKALPGNLAGSDPFELLRERIDLDELAGRFTALSPMVSGSLWVE